MNRYDIQKVKEDADIIDICDLLGIDTKRTGRRVSILCPCHDDHHYGSCFIDPRNQSFHCFSCQSHGDVFTLIQAVRGAGFMDAVEFAAQSTKHPERYLIDETGGSHEVDEDRRSGSLDKDLISLVGLSDISAVYSVMNYEADISSSDNQDFSIEEDENGNIYCVKTERVMKHPLRELANDYPEDFEFLIFSKACEQAIRFIGASNWRTDLKKEEDLYIAAKFLSEQMGEKDFQKMCRERISSLISVIQEYGSRLGFEEVESEETLPSFGTFRYGTI